MASPTRPTLIRSVAWVWKSRHPPPTDHERRMVLRDEWPWIVAALDEGPERDGMTASERHMLCDVATGLRSAELRDLKRSSPELSGNRTAIFMRAAPRKSSEPFRICHQSLLSVYENTQRQKHRRPPGSICPPIARWQQCCVRLGCRKSALAQRRWQER